MGCHTRIFKKTSKISIDDIFNSHINELREFKNNCTESEYNEYIIDDIQNFNNILNDPKYGQEYINQHKKEFGCMINGVFKYFKDMSYTEYCNLLEQDVNTLEFYLKNKDYDSIIDYFETNIYPIENDTILMYTLYYIYNNEVYAEVNKLTDLIRIASYPENVITNLYELLSFIDNHINEFYYIDYNKKYPDNLIYGNKDELIKRAKQIFEDNIDTIVTFG